MDLHAELRRLGEIRVLAETARDALFQTHEQNSDLEQKALLTEQAYNEATREFGTALADLLVEEHADDTVSVIGAYLQKQAVLRMRPKKQLLRKFGPVVDQDAVTAVIKALAVPVRRAHDDMFTGSGSDRAGIRASIDARFGAEEAVVQALLHAFVQAQENLPLGRAAYLLGQVASELLRLQEEEIITSSHGGTKP